MLSFSRATAFDLKARRERENEGDDGLGSDYFDASGVSERMRWDLAPHLNGAHFGEWYYDRTNVKLLLIQDEEWDRYEEHCERRRASGFGMEDDEPFCLS